MIRKSKSARATQSVASKLNIFLVHSLNLRSRGLAYFSHHDEHHVKFDQNTGCPLFCLFLYLSNMTLTFDSKIEICILSSLQTNRVFGPLLGRFPKRLHNISNSQGVTDTQNHGSSINTHYLNKYSCYLQLKVKQHTYCK